MHGQWHSRKMLYRVVKELNSFHIFWLQFYLNLFIFFAVVLMIYFYILLLLTAVESIFYNFIILLFIFLQLRRCLFAWDIDYNLNVFKKWNHKQDTWRDYGNYIEHLEETTVIINFNAFSSLQNLNFTKFNLFKIRFTFPFNHKIATLFH